MELSDTQKATLEAMRTHGGELVRLRGGFWTWRNHTERSVGVPAWSCELGTLRALEKRGLVTLIVESQTFYTLARITEAGQAAA